MRIQVLGLIALVVVLATTFNNCSKVSFQQAPQATQNSSLTTTDNKNFDFTATLNVTASTRKALDLVWVIDNSGSMSQEAAHVNTNFANFAQQVQAQTDVKMALISTSTGNYGVRLPIVNSRFLQLDQEVDSVNALVQLSSALCTASVAFCSNFSSLPVSGQLRSFIRADSKKIFIVVSDDESSLSGPQFTSVIQQLYPGQTSTLFGFVGLGPQSPCQARTGQTYIDLASQSGGKTFNICNADWTSTFAELTQSVVSLSVPPVTLPHASSQITVTLVELNGQRLSPSQYTLGPDGLLISSSLISANTTYAVHVKYSLNP